jgi:hypothetical protein
MKKSILLILLVAFLAVAVGVSGCLDNDGNKTNTTPENNTSNNTTNITFDENIVKVSPVPTGFTLEAVKNVTADNENIGGVTDALVGYSATYMYNNSSVDCVYLSAFQCNSSTDAAGYVQKMIDAHNAKYPESKNVTTVTVNGHNATLLTTVSQGSSGGERCEIAWNNGEYLIVVNGPAAYNLILAIADASSL